MSFILALEATPYHVDTAEDGEIGIKLFMANVYDLIYLDLRMPKLNGIDVLRAIRKVNSTIPVYIVTAFHKEYFQELKAVEKEQITYQLLQKPITNAQILAITKSILEKVPYQQNQEPQDLQKKPEQVYFLKIYIVGKNSVNQDLVKNVDEILTAEFKDQYNLITVDLLEDPVLKEGEQIIATPTIVKLLPLPVKQVFGDLTDKKTLLVGLDMVKKK